MLREGAGAILVTKNVRGGRHAPSIQANPVGGACRVVRRHGRVYVINKKNPRMKARQG